MITKKVALGLILSITMIVVGIVFAAPRQTVTEPPSLCVDETTKNHMRELLLHGLDVALENRVQDLFEVWMREGGDRPAPRARKGLEQGVSAYVHARSGISTWDAPACP